MDAFRVFNRTLNKTSAGHSVKVVAVHNNSGQVGTPSEIKEVLNRRASGFHL